MGIMHIYTFLKKCIPNAIADVDINEEFKNFKKNHPLEVPTIYVDLLALWGCVFENQYEIVLGGRFNLYNERTKKIFDTFASLEANIVYFIEINCEQKKMKELNREKIEKYERRNEESFSLMQEIKYGINLNRELTFKQDRIISFKHFLEAMARDSVQVQYIFFNNFEQEMAYYAQKNKVFAIISDNTEFLIYEGRWKFWWAKSINFNNMTIQEFKKSAIKFKLGLSSEQMALLAALCGNNIMPYTMVKNYHYRLSGKQKDNKFFKMAEDLRRNMRISSRPPFINDNIKKEIQRRVFSAEDKEEGIKYISESLNMYNFIEFPLFFRENHELKDIFERIKSNPINIICKILFKNYFYVYSDLIDLSDKRPFTMTYFEMIFPILLRLMGVVLKHKQPCSRKIYTKTKQDSPIRSFEVEPEYPPYEIPDIISLLYEQTTSDLENLKNKLFCWMISKNLRSGDLFKVPKKNLLNVATIFYLVEIKQLSIEDGDYLLVASNCPLEIAKDLSVKDLNEIDPLDAKIAFLFIRIYEIVFHCLKSVGLDAFSNVLEFDGLYFHYLRQKYRCRNKSEFNALKSKYNDIRIYSDQ